MTNPVLLRQLLRPCAALACAVALVIPAPVLAAPPATPTDPKAEALLQEGVAEYEAGNYEGAIAKLKKGHEVQPALAFLYTWAQAERQLGNCKEAIKLYDQVVEAGHETLTKYANAGIRACAEVMVDEDEGEAVADEEEVDDFEEEVAEPEPEPVAAEPAEGSEDRKPRAWYQDPLGGSLVAVGVVGIGVGAGLLAKAHIDNQRNVEQTPDPGDDMLDYGEFQDRQKRVETFRIAGGVVAGVGGALLIGGVIRWAVLGTRQKRNAVAVSFGREFTGLTWRGRF